MRITESTTVEQLLASDWLNVKEASKLALELVKLIVPRDAKVRSSEFDGDITVSVERGFAVGAAPELLEALKVYEKAVTALSDQQLIENQPLMSAIVKGREAMAKAEGPRP